MSAEVTVVNPLLLNTDFDYMIDNSTGNIVAIVLLALLSVLFFVLIIYFSISNAKRFASVDYESDEDEPSEEENQQQEVESEGMSSISGDEASGRGEPLMDADGKRLSVSSVEEGRVGSEGYGI